MKHRTPSCGEACKEVLLSQLFVRRAVELGHCRVHQRDDVSLANPLGPAVRGWKKVVETAERAASNYRDGEPIHFENLVKVVTPDLAFIVETERSKVKVGGRPDLSTVVLRVTAIFRPEEGVWKIVHRHADTIVSNQPVVSLIQK